MTTVRFTARGPLHYSVNFAYDPSVVAMIKTVPARGRTYEPDTKTWMIDAYYADTLADELRNLGHVVVGIAQNNDWAKALLRTVGPERADQVVRALTRIIHPDNPDTGDADLQRQLNTARDEVIR